MAGPSRASPTLPSVIGSRSIRTSSRETGTVVVTSSVTTYLRSRARPVCTRSVPTRSCSSERVMASSVVGPEVSWPTVPWALVSANPAVVVSVPRVVSVRSVSVRPLSANPAVVSVPRVVSV
jgi:hypothetical protein